MSIKHPHIPSDNSDAEHDPSFPGKKGPSPFGLPENYFDQLAGKITQRLQQEDSEELSAYPLLKALPKQLPFAVPDAYFESSAQALERQEELAGMPLLAAGIPMAMETPETYFEQSAARIALGIEQQEELAALPLLASHRKRQPFFVPLHYFDDLATRVKERLHQPAGTSLLRVWWQTWLNTIFAPKTALAFGTLVIVGLFFLLVKPQQPGNTALLSEDCTTLACLDKHDLMSENEMRHMDEESLMTIVDVNALSNSLQMNTSGQASLDYVMDNTNTQTLLDALP